MSHSLVPALLPDESDAPGISARGIPIESLLTVQNTTAASATTTVPAPTARMADKTDYFHITHLNWL